MSFYTIYSTLTGEVRATLTSTSSSFTELNLKENEDYLLVDAPVNSDTTYIDVVEKTLVTFPSKENPYLIWDWETLSWVNPTEVTGVKIDLKASIDSIRRNLALQPIVYDNKALDADTQAQTNINGKIQEIVAREAINSTIPVELMVWRDADDIDHSWTNQNDYKLWLQGLVIAISSRNTALYAIAWTKKAEVEALTDINDIINYDVNAGW